MNPRQKTFDFRKTTELSDDLEVCVDTGDGRDAVIHLKWRIAKNYWKNQRWTDEGAELAYEFLAEQILEHFYPS